MQDTQAQRLERCVAELRQQLENPSERAREAQTGGDPTVRFVRQADAEKERAKLGSALGDCTRTHGTTVPNTQRIAGTNQQISLTSSNHWPENVLYISLHSILIKFSPFSQLCGLTVRLFAPLFSISGELGRSVSVVYDIESKSHVIKQSKKHYCKLMQPRQPIGLCFLC